MISKGRRKTRTYSQICIAERRKIHRWHHPSALIPMIRLSDRFTGHIRVMDATPPILRQVRQPVYQGCQVRNFNRPLEQTRGRPAPPGKAARKDPSGVWK